VCVCVCVWSDGFQASRHFETSTRFVQLPVCWYRSHTRTGPPTRRCTSRLMQPCCNYSNGPDITWACVCWYPSASVSTASNASRQYRISPATPSFDESTFQAEQAGNTLYGSEACSCCREVPATDALTPVTGRHACLNRPCAIVGPDAAKGVCVEQRKPGHTRPPHHVALHASYLGTATFRSASASPNSPGAPSLHTGAPSSTV